MSCSKRAFFFTALFALVSITDVMPVAAQEEASEEADPRLAEARHLFQEAQGHFTGRRYVLAAQTFRRTHALMMEAGAENAPMILFNIGRALEMAPGHEEEARDAYQRFLAEADTENPAIRGQLANVQASIRELEARIESRVAPEESEVEEELAPQGLAISPIGLSILGVGVAALLAGSAVGVVTLLRDDELSSMCEGGVCPTASRGLAEEVESLALAADVSVAIGAALAATGLILTLVLQEGEEDEREAAVTAGCGPVGCGMLLQGVF